MGPNPLSPFVTSLFFVFLILFSVRAISPSPSALTDLICHTNHASECYPRIFQPTTSFQPVHDEQELPAGLHIRLNLETGQKEARLNVASPAELDTGSDLVIIDETESPKHGTPDTLHVGPSILKHSVLDHGPIRPPSLGSGESSLFATNIASLTSAPPFEPGRILMTLDTLEDLSHDIYWGVTLAKDGAAVQRLLELFDRNDADPAIRGSAALVLGTAIQNNPAALSAVMSHYDDGTYDVLPIEHLLKALAREEQPQVLTRLMYLLSAMCQDSAQFERFEHLDGFYTLLRTYDADHVGTDAKNKLRGKIANFLLDHFMPNSHLETLTNENSNSAGVEEEEIAVILDSGNPTLQHDISHETDTRSRSVPSMTRWKPWLAAFTKSLDEWKSRSSEPEIADAIQSVQDAHLALQKNLAAYGKGCPHGCFRLL
ncbi:hypothetical protein MMC08_003591 [Hypocenomyce scalaris]|nr:hypothetical protein [Hypocenomyce scalaris]